MLIMGYEAYRTSSKELESSEIKIRFFSDFQNQFVGNYFSHCSTMALRRSAKAVLVGEELIR